MIFSRNIIVQVFLTNQKFEKFKFGGVKIGKVK